MDNSKNNKMTNIIAVKERLDNADDISDLLGKEFENYKGQSAINKLMQEKQGHIKEAFYRKDIGNIDLIWGNERIGLEHILRQRTKEGLPIKEFLLKLTDTIENGVLRKSARGNYEVLRNNHIAVIQPEFKGNKFNFIVTAYKTRKTSWRG